jgi:hypothetical protein
MGNTCSIHLSPICIVKVNQQPTTQQFQVNGSIILECIDYTEKMSYEGIKPTPTGNHTNVTYKILWANDTTYYDDQGNLLQPDA